MRRLAVLALIAVLASAAEADPQVDAAIRALRKDSSLKVRTQAAIVLGQRGSREALGPLREALENDDAAAVRIAAIAALAKIGGRSVRATLKDASKNDSDAAVRAAAARAIGDLQGQLAFSIEEPSGSAGGASARAALRRGLARHLMDRGFAVVDHGGLRLKPAVLRVDVDERGGKTIIAVKASVVAVDSHGRMAAILESGARLSASGAVSRAKIPAYSERALDAAARTLCEDLAAKLGER